MSTSVTAKVCPAGKARAKSGAKMWRLLKLGIGLMAAMATASAQMWIAGYYIDTSLYMQDVPFSKMTHAIHFKIKPADNNGAITGIPAANAQAFTTAAHAAGKKALVCIGDMEGNIGFFSNSLVNNFNGFVNNIVNFVNANGYDGVDLDWEAGNYRSNPDQGNYIRLANALKAALGPNKLVTMAVYWNNGLEQVVQGAAASLSQVNVMCYDMDMWRTSTFYNAASVSASGDTTNPSCGAQAAQFGNYISRSKIGLGIAFYGRMWQGCSNSSCSDGLYAPMQSWYGTPTSSTVFYRSLVTSSYWSQPKSWDSVRKSSYISVNGSGASGDRFISFTGEQQIQELVSHAKANGYGGVMEFEVEYDFISTASGDARHPLMAAVHAAVNNTAVPPPPVNDPPILSGASPTGALASTTTQTTMAVTTNESATCRYATTAGVGFSSMPYTFSATGGLTHSTVVTGLSAGSSYNYYVRCSDTAGAVNTTDYPISFSVAQAVVTQPNPYQATPSSGTGASQSFKLMISDPSGAANLNQIAIVFDTGASQTNSCRLEVGPQSRLLFLQANDNASWSQAVLGSAGTLSNSQCNVNAATSSAVVSGTNLTVTLGMGFSGSFAGTKNIYVFAASAVSGSSGWKQLGTWTVPAVVVPPPPANTAPTVTVSPYSGSGSKTTYTLTATDQQGASTISQLVFLLGSEVGAVNSCWLEYAPGTRTLYLKSDNNGSATSSQIGVSGSAALSNSQCTVSASQSTATVSGNTLTVKLVVSYGRSWLGLKNLFGFAADNQGGLSGWKTIGSYTVK